MSSNDWKNIWELTSLDRCDKSNCGAQARAIVLYKDLPVIFCRHHVEDLREVIESQGGRIYTQYKELNNE